MDRYLLKTMASVASMQEFEILEVKSLCRAKRGLNFEENYHLKAQKCHSFFFFFFFF